MPLRRKVGGRTAAGRPPQCLAAAPVACPRARSPRRPAASRPAVRPSTPRLASAGVLWAALDERFINTGPAAGPLAATLSRHLGVPAPPAPEVYRTCVLPRLPRLAPALRDAAVGALLRALPALEAEDAAFVRSLAQVGCLVWGPSRAGPGAGSECLLTDSEAAPGACRLPVHATHARRTTCHNPPRSPLQDGLCAQRRGPAGGSQ